MALSTYTECALLYNVMTAINKGYSTTQIRVLGIAILMANNSAIM